MKSARTVLSGILYLSICAAAHAQCDARLISGDDLVGKPAWLAHNLPSNRSLTVAEFEGLSIPVLKQVGPTAWEPSGERSLRQGTMVTVTKIVAATEDNLPIYIEVEAGPDDRVVVNSMNVMGYDFTACKASELLSGGHRNGFSSQWMRSLPMRLKEGARPTEDGKWIDAAKLEKLRYVDCIEYDRNVLNPRLTRCTPVWEDVGDMNEQATRPSDIYVTDEMIEQVIDIED
ncbi:MULTISPECIES: hypothetical protein [unclassified Mesorhizobium]|uniref:hypothetical protein n=1 Tax=unclassified Mesorhizobium TaxID=325217 RepID=UPI000FC9EAE2|nr:MULTISPECIES: hypothetical protein [unclassified Mesorhizobium]RUX98044.1 hypothetical protein EN993_00960 [Mesorhizobium sp. M7D.F.Ca.US.004.01.2.1]RVA31906.1 hypothetical protein EN935_12800 [Mesorhizobium sp. M7D.F.Ca.US.004.03.1.1]